MFKRSYQTKYLPVPQINDSLNALFSSKYFSTLDSGYWQVPLYADAQEKLTLATRSTL